MLKLLFLRPLLASLLVFSVTETNSEQQLNFQNRNDLISKAWNKVSIESKKIRGVPEHAEANDTDVFLHEFTRLKAQGAKSLPNRFRRGHYRNYKYTWRLGKPSKNMPYDVQHACIKLVYRMFSSVAELQFRESPDDASTTISFEENYAKRTGDLAYSYWGGDIHIDDRVQWKCPVVDHSDGREGINLQRVLLHHIGHTLKLPHSDRYTSVMNRNDNHPGETHIDFDDLDIKTIHQQYAPCDLTYDFVMEIETSAVEIGPASSTQPSSGFETFFVKGEKMWKFDYKIGRATWESPFLPTEQIGRFFPGTQAYTFVPKLEHHLFFFEDSVIMFEKSLQNIEPDYPKRIVDVFPPKKGSTMRVPDNIDAAFFNEKDSLLYLFKDTKVYVYDYLNMGPTGGCCERINDFVNEFPSPFTPKLTGNVDTVFFSHRDNFLYFFHEKGLWMNEGYSESRDSWLPWNATESNELHYMGETKMFFSNICPTENN